jgi:hypothetical protein
MIPGYTTIDMLRTINQEMVERHLKAARMRELPAVQGDRSTLASLKGFVRRGRS